MAEIVVNGRPPQPLGRIVAPLDFHETQLPPKI